MYKYLLVLFPDENQRTEDLLNHYGSKGWRLVQIVPERRIMVLEFISSEEEQMTGSVSYNVTEERSDGPS